MTSPQPPRRISPFEAIRRTDDEGEAYWIARELMPLLGYQKWQDFHETIERAMEDCRKSDRSVDENFTQARKVSGKRGPPQLDYRLSRYACHLITMAARTQDAVAAHARTYFSDQVESAEAMDAQLVSIEELIQQARMRVETRDRLSGSYDQLEAVAAAMGMVRREHYARLHNAGDVGMFGMSKDELAKRHSVTPQKGKRKVNMNDHLATPIMGSIIVRNTIAGADISQMQHPTNQDMWDASHDAGAEVRELLMRHGIKPEDVPPEPHISEAERLASGQIPLFSTEPPVLDAGQDETLAPPDDREDPKDES